MELRLYLVKPKIVQDDVEIPADDVRIEMDKKTGDAKRDPFTQQPIVEDLGTKSVQHGTSIRFEYPNIRGMKVTELANTGDSGILWLVEATPVTHNALIADNRVQWISWKQAEAKCPLLSERVMPGSVKDPLE